MVRNKNDMNKYAIIAAIKILSKTTKSPKRSKSQVMKDWLLAGGVYALVLAGILIPILILL